MWQNWQSSGALDWRVGREGVVIAGGSLIGAATIDSSKYLRLRFVPIDQNGDNGPWTALGIRLTNKSFSANTILPFGVKVDLLHRKFSGTMGDKAFYKQFTGLWIAKNNGISGNQLGEQLEDYFGIGAEVGPDYNPEFQGRLFGAFQSFNLTQAKRPDGRITNISGITNYSRASGSTNAIGYMLTHDGTNITFFINPDVSNKNAYPNEYCIVDTKAVTWNSDIQIILMSENRYMDQEDLSIWDEMMVSMAADSSEPVISNRTVEVSTNSTDYRRFSININHAIGSTNTGINTVKIVKHSGWTEWRTNTFRIFSDYNNDNILEELSIMPFPDDSLAVSECTFLTNGHELWIRLGKQIDSAVSNKTIRIDFESATPAQGSYEWNTWVNSILYDPHNNQTNIASCGYQQGSGSSHTITVTPALGDANAYSAIKPNEIFLGPNYFSMVYYIQAYAANTTNIREAIIEIPYEFSNCTFSNFDSILMGTNETGKILRMPPLAGVTQTNDYIKLDYSSFDNFYPGGLDVISFEIHNTSSLNAKTNVKWRSWVDYANIGALSSQAGTNTTYVSQNLTIQPQPLDAAWDYQIISAANYAPVSMGISNITALASFDIIADGENTTLEAITNCEITVGGNTPDLKGFLHFYRDTNNSGVFSTNDLPVFTTNISLPVTRFYFTESNQNTAATNPTRYWIAAEITNKAPAVFTNTINIKITDLSASGPQGGVIDNENAVTAGDNKTARIDTHQIFVSAENLVNGSIKQGTFNNLGMKIIISNNDPDATNYLYRLYVTNHGSADQFDFGTMKLYADNGDDVFNNSSDIYVMSGSMNNNKYFSLFNMPAWTMYGTGNETFWAVFDVNIEADNNDTVSLQILHNTNIMFYDNYGDHSDPRPVPIGIPQFGQPQALTTNIIIPFSSKDYDFYLYSVSYGSMPVSFSTNQFVPVGNIRLFMDTENSSTQRFTGLDVKISSSGTDENVSGILYILTNSTNLGAVAASNFVTAGADCSINCSLSNFSTQIDLPDTMYLYFLLTNTSAAVFSNTVRFQITNVLCQGPNGGIFTNTGILAPAQSTESRIDQFRVSVNFISNEISTYFPKQGSFNNCFLKIEMAGNDPDATNYLDFIDIKTNGLSTASNTHIANVKLYLDDGNRAFSNDTVKAVTSLAANGSARFTPASPIPLPSTNKVLFYIGYDVTSEDDSAVGRFFGLSITNIGFTDSISDNYPQNSFTTDNTSGPAVQDKVTIVTLTSRVWDYKITSAENCAPVSINRSNIYAMASFEIIRDGEDAAETITNIIFNVEGSTPDVYGKAYLYRDTNDSAALDIALDKPAGSNALLAGANYISCSENYNSTDPLYPDKFWIAIEITNAANAVFSNTLRLKITNIMAAGPNSGAVTNLHILTNTFNNLARIDSYALSAHAVNLLTGSSTIKQGSFNNLHSKIIFSNTDPDATNFFSGLTLTNIGNAGQGDLGYYQIYRDNGNAAFSAAEDSLVGYASAGTDNRFIININPAQAVYSGETIFWGAFNVEFGADIDDTIAFQIINPSVNMVFSDQYNDAYTIIPGVSGDTEIPKTITTNRIAPYNTQTYDFYLKNVNYDSMPQSFNSNKIITAGYADIVMDVENTNTQVFQGMDVKISSTGVKNNISGIAYIYRDTTNTSGLFASNFVSAGNDFAINCAMSNLSMENDSPTRLFLSFLLTNDINYTKTNTVSFQITNLRSSGPNLVFTNLHILT
ncbi:MAG TPA: hypothetical protein DC049_17405, partial [Spirochaetia bacterium]|nr:hypothetical protein [Spirochaetia bacterium]